MTDSGLLKKFIDERFKGVSPQFSDARFDGAEVKCAQDKKNWYMFYSPAPVIIVQGKEMRDPPYCYECKGPIHYVAKICSIHFEEFGGLVGAGDVRTRNIPYCPNCNQKPPESDIVSESVQESLRQ